MAVKDLSLIVSIDTECDKSANWHVPDQVTFRGVVDAIPNRLQPLFAAFGVRPTYLLSPEVMANPSCRDVLKDLKNCELGTHLHGDFFAPSPKSKEMRGGITDEMQWEYAPELEREKLSALTALFKQQFLCAPRSFRAGRFGIGYYSGLWLKELGYWVDSSVTPHVRWTSRKGVKFPDFQDFPEKPYRVSTNGDIWHPGDSDLLEVPLTILAPGLLPGIPAQEPVWFRPWYSPVEVLKAIIQRLAAEAEGNSLPRPLVMMFHNVEVVPGASPYPQNEKEVSAYLDILKSVFEFAGSRGIRFATLQEYYQRFTNQAPQKEAETGVGQIIQKKPAVSEKTVQPENIIQLVTQQSRTPLKKELTIPPHIVFPILDHFQVQPWFKYIYAERASRWDVWKTCMWVANNLPKNVPVLEVGCGVGFNLIWLAENGFTELYGTDIDEKAILSGQEMARQQNYPIKFWVDDGYNPARAPEKPLGAILCLNWTYLSEEFNFEKLVQRYSSMLAPGGVMVIDNIDAAYNYVPNNQYLTSDWPKPVDQRKPSEYKVRMADKDIREIFDRNGFSVLGMITEQQLIPKNVYMAQKHAPAVEKTTGPAIQPEVLKTFHLLPSNPRVLLIADVPNWIFERHCKMLQKYLSSEFDFDIKFMGEPYDENNYDLIYPLEWNLVKPELILHPEKYVTGIRSHLSWEQLNIQQLVAYLQNKFARVHVVSRRLLDVFEPYIPKVVYLTHGVDTQFFTPKRDVDSSGRKIRIGWAGNRQSAGRKGFLEILEPLSKLPGVEFVFCGFDSRQLSLEEMRDFYDSIDVYICASATEGSNNPLLEAASMERAIVTTDVGTVPEYLKDGENAFIVPRELNAFIRAVETLRDSPTLRRKFGLNARKALLDGGWDWNVKAKEFSQFFHQTIEQNRPLRIGFGDIKINSQARAEELVKEASDAYGKNDLTRARMLLEKSLSLNPNSVENTVILGNVLLKQGDLEASYQQFLNAANLAPAFVPAYVNQAAVLIMQGKLKKAEKVLRFALTFNSSNMTAKNLLNIVMEKISTEEARQAAEETKPASPSASSSLVSVIVPTHNRRKMLSLAIRSILNQTYKNIEVLVVNDAGEDVADVVEYFHDPRVKYFSHRENKGLGAARNTGIQNAQGKYVAYLDDDDLFYPEHVETLVNFLEKSDYKVAYSDAYRAKQRKENGEYVTYDRDLIYSIDYDPDLVLIQNIMPVLCMMHERACLEKAGLFDESLSVYEDWDLWIRLSRYYPFAHLKQITCEYTWRVDGTTMSSSRSGFRDLLPEIYSRYHQYAVDRPDVLEKQKVVMENSAKRLRFQKAEAVLNKILSEDNLSAGLQKYRDELTPEVVLILQDNAQEARDKGEADKAKWIEGIAESILQMITPKSSPVGTEELEKKSQAIELLKTILGSGDILASLKANEDKFDTHLLEITQLFARKNREEWNNDLADALDELAKYIEQKLKSQ